MNRLILMSALFLSGCGDRDTRADIPEALLREVKVECPSGETSRALGNCAIRLRQGLNIANSQLTAIAEIEKGIR